MNKTLLKTSRWLHKWAGLILGIQILLWILGGLVMSAIPLEKVHGKHLASREQPAPLPQSEYVFPIQRVLDRLSSPVKSIELLNYLGKPLYRVASTDGEFVYNAIDGNLAEAVSESEAQQIAAIQYLGSGTIIEASKGDRLPAEAGGAERLHWQVTFDDTWGTTLYLDALTGQVITVRSDIWRLFDFFWMLHIMDYDEREDFNNPLLISFAASALIFTLTGFVMLYQSFAPALRRRIKRS